MTCGSGGRHSDLRSSTVPNHYYKYWESHPAHEKNSGLLVQKLLAATNGELYTAV